MRIVAFFGFLGVVTVGLSFTLEEPRLAIPAIVSLAVAAAGGGVLRAAHRRDKSGPTGG